MISAECGGLPRAASIQTHLAFSAAATSKDDSIQRLLCFGSSPDCASCYLRTTLLALDALLSAEATHAKTAA